MYRSSTSTLLVLIWSCFTALATCAQLMSSTEPNEPNVNRISTFMKSGPHRSLFGKAAITPAPSAAFKPGVHPRVLFDQTGWEELLERYSNEDNFDVTTSWSHFSRRTTLHYADSNPILKKLAQMERDGETGVYNGERDWSTASGQELDELEELASHVMNMTERYCQSFFMCAVWSSVNEKVVRERGIGESFTTTSVDDCVKASVGWAKVLLAHRAVTCAGKCGRGVSGSRGFLWDEDKWFQVQNDWYSAGASLALTLDVLYERFGDEERKFVVSALSMLMYKQTSWGTAIESSRRSPNAARDPHRIFSNWALYHGHLYITNLVLEGEHELDAYASAVLWSSGEDGFNVELDKRFTALIRAYMTHAVYPDGSTFEDGYTYFIALREGSLALVAAERRGVGMINTERFRGLIHNVAQMMEPWQCARVVGHSSGGGISYPAWAALFKYAYPDGALPQMVWKQRMGKKFKNNNPCRIQWGQNVMHMTVLGMEHGSSTFAESPQGLEEEFGKHFPLSYFSPRRGLLIARSSLGEDALYVHFDARPDAMFPGHDNADRGIFTLTAFKTAWVDDYLWKQNIDSRKHSLLHVDGMGQGAKAPSVRMVRTEDTGKEVVAVADLTYAYNVQWAANWPYDKAPSGVVTVYDEDGRAKEVREVFDVAEYGHPQKFGWPADDDGADLGFTREGFNMHGDAEVGFRGMWTWKRKYRERALSWMVRSVVLNRGGGGLGFLMVVDSVRVSGRSVQNKFESYVALGDKVEVERESSICEGNRCRIVLVDDGIAQVDVHVVTVGRSASYRTERFKSDKEHTRLVVGSENEGEELIWMAFYPHLGEPERFSIEEFSSGAVKVVLDDEELYYEVDGETHGVREVVEMDGNSPKPAAPRGVNDSVLPSSTLSATPSASVSASASPSVSMSASASPSVSVSASASPSVSMSASASPSVSVSASSSPSSSPVPSASPSSSPVPSASPSSSLVPSASPGSSAIPSASRSAAPSVSASLSSTTSASASMSAAPSASVNATPSVSAGPKSSDTSVSKSRKQRRWRRKWWWRRNWWRRNRWRRNRWRRNRQGRRSSS